MHLHLSQIREITTGAVRVSENEEGIHFYRFTGQQEMLYKKRSDDFYMKTFSTSGICLQFRTNSENLFLRASVAPGSSRTYFSFDVFVDGEKVDNLDNFSDIELPRDYTKIAFSLGEVSKSFHIGGGEKDVCIYLPWSVNITLKDLEIDDNSFIKPIKPKKKMLCFGDSITQGYDALYPSRKYITRIARMLDAQEYNKAIGGEIFYPELAATREDFKPDYITVAYGTNDWNKCTQDEFQRNCREFFNNLTSNYPDVKVFAITPIWRKDFTEHREFGSFEKVEEIIRTITKDYENITVISGFDFVSHNENFYADLRLHPNDEGFEQYFKNLAKQITT